MKIKSARYIFMKPKEEDVMKVYITASGLYQVQNANNYSVACFDSLVKANVFIRRMNFLSILRMIK